MKAHIKNHLSLSKKEWNGMVVLLILIALVLMAPYAVQLYSKDTTINANEFKAAVAALNKVDPQSASENTVRSHALFKFDPNAASTITWQQLGLTAKQAGTIKNYLAKGGSFRKTEDLKKIYGISEAEYQRLAPFVTLPKEKIVPSKVVELNTADSASLVAIEGIGPAFAKRILYYRERLGGFVAKEQLKEVFGIDELKYDDIKTQVTVNARRIRKINLNSITFDKLRLMPYLTYKQVNAIIEYRKQHGDYSSIEDLRNIAIIDADILRKIEPYLIYK